MFLFSNYIYYVHDYDDETYRSIRHNHFLVAFNQDVEKSHFPPVRCLQNLSWKGRQNYDLKVDLAHCMLDRSYLFTEKAYKYVYADNHVCVGLFINLGCVFWVVWSKAS